MPSDEEDVARWKRYQYFHQISEEGRSNCSNRDGVCDIAAAAEEEAAAAEEEQVAVAERLGKSSWQRND